MKIVRFREKRFMTTLFGIAIYVVVVGFIVDAWSHLDFPKD